MREIRAAVRAHFQPTDEDWAVLLRSGEPRFKNHESWALGRLLRAGLIEKPDPKTRPEIRRLTQLGRRVVYADQPVDFALLRTLEEGDENLQALSKKEQ